MGLREIALSSGEEGAVLASQTNPARDVLVRVENV
jgi:hypothetical protein